MTTKAARALSPGLQGITGNTLTHRIEKARREGYDAGWAAAKDRYEKLHKMDWRDTRPSTGAAALKYRWDNSIERYTRSIYSDPELRGVRAALVKEARVYRSIIQPVVKRANQAERAIG